MNKTSTKLVITLAFAFLWTGLFSKPILAADIRFGEVKGKLTVGIQTTIPVKLSGGEMTLGTDLVISFDPQKIQVVRVEGGSLYPSYNPVEKQRIDEEKGLITISGSATYGKLVKAEGDFAAINLVPLSSGKTTLQIKYTKGSTTETGVIDQKGNDLLSTEPPPLILEIKSPSIFFRLQTFFSRIFQRR